MLPAAVLDSGSGISIIGDAEMQRMNEMWPDVHAVFPYESALKMTMANGRNTKSTQ